MKRKLITFTIHDPETEALVREFYEEFGKYARSDEETSRLVDREMGERSLSEELIKMRGE